MTDTDEKTHAVVCDACGAVDELDQEDTALRVADDHRRRQPDADEHDVVVLTEDTARKPTGFSRGRKRVSSMQQSTDYSIADSPTV
jgi:hypothetical protein